MTDIQIKRGIGKPDSLLEGELAIDTSTGMLYSLVGGVVTELNEPPEEVDLSDYVDKTKQNDVAEGQFRLVWDHSYDPDFPFNGAIGYDGNNDDPDSVGGSFLYAKGTRGTVSIGRDGDMELHGPSEIKGMPDRDGHLPWITDFEYVQAADFKDADGNSIIGQGGGASVHIGEAPPEDPQEGQQWLETPADGDAKMWVYDGAVWLEQPSNASGATVGTSHVVLEPDARNTLPSDLATQKDVNLYLSDALDKLLDDDGNPIGGGDDLHITYNYNGESGGWGFDRPGGGLPVISFDVGGGAVFSRGVESYTWIKGKDYLATDGNIYARGGYVQASDFRDADGNSIVGGGGGDSIKAEWLGEDGKTYIWWVSHPGLTETKNAYRFFNYETDDPSENNPAASGLIVPSGTSYISSINSHSIIARKIDTTVGPDTDSDYSLIRTRRINSTFSNFGESNIYGGINILGADAERPEELPYSPDEKSVQYALTVSHETLGRTVEIDKEGIIRANQFTDMAGNPMSVSPATMVEAFTTLQTAVADEDTLEGVKTALTNALGGLIEKFEGMQNV